MAGIKVYGAYSRMRDQKSVALFARKEYGKGSFEYKFFKNKPFNKFESIVLRNSGNDYEGLRFQDCFLTGLTDDMDIDKQAFQPAAVYLNGQYWGILNIREKVNEHYIANNHSVDPDKVNILEKEGELITGSNQTYQELLNFLDTHSTLQDDNNFNFAVNNIDIDNYIQYQLTEIYINNRDWPGNNIKYWSTTSPSAKWRWILFDTDFGFGLNGDYSDFNTLEFALATDGPFWPNPPWSTLLLRRFVSNIGFRFNFINQYADRINTDFRPEIIDFKLDSLQLLYNNEIQNHIARWGGDYNWWLNIIDQRKGFGQQRPVFALGHIQSIFNLGSQLNIKIEVSSASQGMVKLNSVIPKNYPFNGIYFEDVPIKMTAVPKPGYKFDRWEGTNNSTDLTIEYDMNSAGNFKAYFSSANESDISVIINEINYNSSDIYPSKDWIELMNNGLATVDLTGWVLTDSDPDKGYVFPSGTILAPNEYIVIYTDLENFKTVHPNVKKTCGSLPFGLSSSGDNIRLYNTDLKLVDLVEYDTYSPWDNGADGTGATLQLLEPASDNNQASNWMAGILGGTPGRKNSWEEITDFKTIISNNTSGFECFPNPFHDFTTIHFNVVTEGNYLLEVYDITGSRVNILTSQFLNQGSYSYNWLGNGTNGEILPAGVYTIRLTNSREFINMKIVLLR
jgi:hypothetical protein